MTSMELIEVDRPITGMLKEPGDSGKVRKIPFVPGRVNRVPTDVFAALRAKKDSEGVSAIDRYLEAGWMTHLNAKIANELAHGERTPAIEQVVVPPLQAAAQTYASVKDAEPDLAAELAEAKAQDAAIRAAEKAAALIKEPPAPKRKG